VNPTSTGMSHFADVKSVDNLLLYFLNSLPTMSQKRCDTCGIICCLGTLLPTLAVILVVQKEQTTTTTNIFNIELLKLVICVVMAKHLGNVKYERYYLSARLANFISSSESRVTRCFTYFTRSEQM